MDWLVDRPEWLAQTVEDILDPALAICDAHHHLWDSTALRGSGGRYLLAEMERDIGEGGDDANDRGEGGGGHGARHNIVATLFCECRQQYAQDGPEELKPVGEVAYMDMLARRSERVARGIIGYADFRLGAAVSRTLEAHMAASARFCGVRHMTRWHEAAEALDVPPRSPRGLMADATWREGFAKLGEHGLPFDAWFLFTQYDELVDLARAFPAQTIVIDHVGGFTAVGPYLGRRDEVTAIWRDGVARAAQCPNVMMKLGGLGQPRCGFGFNERLRPPSSAELAEAYGPYYRYCIEQFGPERCMFESNFPVERASCSYAVLWNAYKRIAEGFSAAERAMLFHDNAMRRYRIKL